VLRILTDLGIEEGERDTRIIEVWNKIDLLEPEAREALVAKAATAPNALAVSSVSGEGIDTLLETISQRLSGVMTEVTVVLPVDKLSLLPWFYQNAIVDAREDREDGSVSLDIRLSENEAVEMERRLGIGQPVAALEPWEE
jgi:GTP-binding protein HflX